MNVLLSPIRLYLKANGPDAITHRLNAGELQIVLAAEIGVSRQGLPDWIERNVPLQQRRRACAHCGELLAPEIAWSLVYHHRCRTPALRAIWYAKCALLRGRQRDRLNYFETLALAEYKRRGYAVNWAPNKASFDFLVNGLRVDVKGSTLSDVRRAYAWCLRPWHLRNQRDYDNLPARCDIFHCVGESGGERTHLILTAEEAGGRHFINLRPPEYCTGRMPNRNLKYVDRWELFNA